MSQARKRHVPPTDEAKQSPVSLERIDDTVVLPDGLVTVALEEARSLDFDSFELTEATWLSANIPPLRRGVEIMIENVAATHGAGEIVDQVRLGASLGSSIIRHAVQAAPGVRERYFDNVLSWDVAARGLSYIHGDDFFKEEQMVLVFGPDVTAELNQIRSPISKDVCILTAGVATTSSRSPSFGEG